MADCFATQADLDGLYALYNQWRATLGDSPEAIALCDALDDFIEACVVAGGGGEQIEHTYVTLVNSVQNANV